MKQGEKYAIEKGFTVFDCTSLPVALVEDTGDAYWDDLEKTHGLIELPYPTMFMAFADDKNLNVSESGMVTSESLHEPLWHEINVTDVLDNDYQEPIDDYAHFEGEIGSFNNWKQFKPNTMPLEIEEAAEFWTSYSTIDFETSEIYNNRPLLAIRMLGVLALMKDKLLGVELRKDPNIKETMRRLRRGLKPTTSKSVVLTLNIAAVRKIAKATPSGSHESPALHWRRGHWRTLNRGSEFEKQVWIRRMLVGDPAKGFVRKSYRIVNEQPMLVE